MDTKDIKPLKTRDAWELEYQNQQLLSIDDVATVDSRDFLRWYFKDFENKKSNPRILDLGCGLGKTLRFAVNNFDCSGLGIDISFNAINLASRFSETKKDFVQFKQADLLEDSIWQEIEKENWDIIIVGTAFHLFSNEQQTFLLEKISLILKKTNGIMYLRTFVLDGDKNAKNLIKMYPGSEKNSYLHPGLGVFEYITEIKNLQNKIQNSEGKILFQKNDFSYQKWESQSYKRKSVIMYIEYGE